MAYSMRVKTDSKDARQEHLNSTQTSHVNDKEDDLCTHSTKDENQLDLEADQKIDNLHQLISHLTKRLDDYVSGGCSKLSRSDVLQSDTISCSDNVNIANRSQRRHSFVSSDSKRNTYEQPTDIDQSEEALDERFTDFQCQLNNQQMELQSQQMVISALREERDQLRKKIQDFRDSIQDIPSKQDARPCSQMSHLERGLHSRQSGSVMKSSVYSSYEGLPVTKRAERIKLKRITSSEQHGLGLEITNMGVCNSRIVDHMVQQVQDESAIEELCCSSQQSTQNIPDYRIKEFELQMEKLRAQIDHLKSDNELLNYSLEESKTQCDHVTTLIAKYESNNTALQMALGYSDQALEAHDLLTNLMTAEIIVKETKSDCNSPGKMTALKERKKAESTARRHLEKWLEGAGDQGSSGRGVKRGSSPRVVRGGSKWEEMKLRECITKLKIDRAAVRLTVTEIESIFDPSQQQLTPVNPKRNSRELDKMDLETAILLQELAALKEEKADLKCKVYMMEKDKASLELRLASREIQEQAYLTHIEQLTAELKEKRQGNENSDDTADTSCAESPADSAELTNALYRETILKQRLDELIQALDKVVKTSELKQQQSSDFISDLKIANNALVQAFDRSKKRYQIKIKRLEKRLKEDGVRTADR